MIKHKAYFFFEIQQPVVTNTNRQTEIPSLVDSCVTKTPSVEILYPQNKCFSLCFRKKHDVLKFWSVKDLSNFSVCCKIVNRSVTSNCCFMSDINNTF